MLEKIVIIVALILVVGAGALAWWFENGPEKKDKAEDTHENGNHNEER